MVFKTPLHTYVTANGLFIDIDVIYRTIPYWHQTLFVAFAFYFNKTIIHKHIANAETGQLTYPQSATV